MPDGAWQGYGTALAPNDLVRLQQLAVRWVRSNAPSMISHEPPNGFDNL